MIEMWTKSENEWRCNANQISISKGLRVEILTSVNANIPLTPSHTLTHTHTAERTQGHKVWIFYWACRSAVCGGTFSTETPAMRAHFHRNSDYCTIWNVLKAKLLRFLCGWYALFAALVVSAIQMRVSRCLSIVICDSNSLDEGWRASIHTRSSSRG